MQKKNALNLSVSSDGQYEYNLENYESAENSFSKSNALINSKYKATLLEQKLLNIMLSRLQRREYIDAGINEGLICSITAKELKTMMRVKSHNFYAQLKPAAAALTSRVIGFENDELQEFTYLALITKAEYKDGVFFTHFNYDLKKYLTPKTQFTMLELPVLLQYRGVYSLRLHEVLLSRCYKKKRAGAAKYTAKETDGRHFCIVIGLNELKLALGVVNADVPAVQRVLAGAGVPDYDKAVERASEKSFNNWSDFKKRVLDPSINEINKTENGMLVRYNLQKAGKGGHVCAIEFFVEFVEANHNAALQAVEMDAQALIKPPLPLSDIRAICEAADYDIERIRRAYDAAAASASPISNLTGFLIQAIRSNYAAAVPLKKKNGFNNFHQREYDYDELERALLESPRN